jgi:tripartite-type tricarboxylate transporter receptor subunit TctC
VDRLAREVVAVLKQPETMERAARAGFLVVGGGPEALARRLEAQYAVSRDIIRQAGIEPR